MSSTAPTNNTTPNDDSAKQLHSMHHSASITGVNEFSNDSTALIPCQNVSPPSFFAKEERQLTNLCSVNAGARVLFATDEWFATADNLLKDSPPFFDPDAYCEQGKVMDGWESRRRREAGHDWCIIKLPSRASIVGIEVDTAHFTGNQVPHLSLEMADLTCTQETLMAMNLPNALERLLHGGVQGTGATPQEVELANQTCRQVQWNELLPKTPLKPGYENTRLHYFTINTPVQGTHVRVNYFPDGGVARLRLWGTKLETLGPKARPAYSPIATGRTCTVVPHGDTDTTPPSQQDYAYPELSSQALGGVGVECSNQHYGNPSNLTQVGLGRDMGDGWETARHPDRPSVLVRNPQTNLVDSPLLDWCILKLGQSAHYIERILLDTKHFRGNYPESVQVQGCFVEDDGELIDNDIDWFVLVPRGRMAPDSEHVYDASLEQMENADRPVSHVKISIYPDGGLSRVRVYGPPM